MPPRLVRTGLADPAWVSAIDEAILDAVADGPAPTTLHVYRRARPTVSLGRFSVSEDVLDRAYCEEEGIAVVRRLSAGGAIYTDPDQVLFGLVGPELSGPPDELLERAGTALAGELASRFGLDAEFVPDNDVHVDGRKVSGMAVAHRRNVGLLHGTLLIRTHPDRMAAALRRPADEFRSGLAGLAELLDRDVPAEDAEESVITTASTLVDEPFVPQDPSEAEEARARHLLSTRYEDPEWTYRR